jgi:hypothetical protein
MRDSSKPLKKMSLHRKMRLSISRSSNLLRPSLLDLAVAQALAAPAMAATIAVNDNGVQGILDSCTLRQSIASANTNNQGSSNCVTECNQRQRYYYLCQQRR